MLVLKLLLIMKVSGRVVWLLVYVAQFSFGLSIDTALSDLSFVQCLNFILSNFLYMWHWLAGMPFSFICLPCKYTNV